MSARQLTALALIASTAAFVASACGGTVVFEEDGGRGLAGQGGNGDGDGDGDGDGGAPSTSGTGGSSASNNPTTTSGFPSSGFVSTGAGPTGVVVSASSGIAGCGTLIDDIGGLGGPQCESCAENVCCAELIDCSQGTACWDCIFGDVCTDQGAAAINALNECVSFQCEQACGGGDCDDGFRCFESGECIPFDFVCDGEFDCADGTDESPDVCGCGPDSFQCFDGQCISEQFVCDGFPDCFEGEDEFCQQEGICDSNLFTGSFDVDQCLGNSCCFEFEQCSDFGEDPGDCIECFDQGGGSECNDAIDCSLSSGCSSICGTGIPTVSPFLDACLSNACCDGWFACLDGGDEACIECVNSGGGPLCDEFVECACGACDLCF